MLFLPPVHSPCLFLFLFQEPGHIWKGDSLHESDDLSSVPRAHVTMLDAVARIDNANMPKAMWEAEKELPGNS